MQTIPIDILICDDDPIMEKRLCALCKASLAPEQEVQLWSTTDPAAVERYQGPFDVALLDMQLPDSSGVALARTLLERSPSVQIIFVSGLLSSVSAVYEVPHLGMVLKEQLDEYLPRFLRRAAALVADARQTGVQVAVKKDQVTVPLAGIAAIERIGHWTYFHMIDQKPDMPTEKKLRTREKLSDLLERMGSPRFGRCHISYAVNFDHVKELQKHDFVVRIGGGETMYVPISRYYEHKAREAFFRYLSNKAEQ